MTEPVKCGCGGEIGWSTYQLGTKDYIAVKCSCGAQGPCLQSKEQAVAAWNLAMGKDLRDAVDEWIARRNGSHGCEPYHDVCDRLEAARKGAK